REGVQHPRIAARGEVGHVASHVAHDPNAEVRAAGARRARVEGHLWILAHSELMVNTTQPLTAPAVSPNMIRFWTSRKKMITGIAVSVEPAMSAPQSWFRLVPRKYESQTVTVCVFWSFRRIRAKMYSFQLVMNANTEVATRPGATSGRRIRVNAPSRVEPSTIAASSSSSGIPTMKPRSVHTQNGRANVR